MGLSRAAHDYLCPAKYLIVSNNIETRKAGIEEALRFELLVNPVVASPVDEEGTWLGDGNPLQPLECLAAVDLQFRELSF